MHDELIDYRTWGERFFTVAVTEERVLNGVNVLAGKPIDVGPMGVGPGRIAKVRARGQIGTATGQRCGADPFVFNVVLPVQLEFSIDLTMDRMRFDADIELPLVITAHGRSDLAIVLDVTPPDPAQIGIRLNAQGLRASLASRAANIEGELRRFIAKYVGRELQKPHIAAVTTIDVRAAIDKAAERVVPRDGSAVADEVADDLSVAMRAELEQTAQIFIDEESRP